MQNKINTSPILKRCVSSLVGKRAAKVVRSFHKKHLLVLAGTTMFASYASETEARQIIPDINLDFLKPKNPLPEQWYAGTLIGYSPAFLAGEGGIEPMSIGNIPIGKYNSNGALHKGPKQQTFYQDEWIKQAITDRISVTVQPTWGITSGGTKGTKNSRLQFEDLPVDFQYRFTSTYSPSLTVNMGFKAPTASINNLGLNRAAPPQGSGTFDLRYGMILQFIQPFFNHQMRYRIWGFGRTPVTHAHLKNNNAYSGDFSATNSAGDAIASMKGFRGTASVGSYGTEGITAEFGLTRQWVLGLDLYSDWASSTKVKGTDPTTGKTITGRTGWETDYNVGPTIEYSYNANLSAAFEVVLMVAGHNTTRTISPQFGVYYAW